MRSRKVAIAGVFALLVASAAAAQVPARPAVPRPSIITQPDWLSKPNGDDLAHAYPQFAWRLEIGGRATISCRVDDLGALQDCRAISEAPQGLRFGEAALSMSNAFHMRPMSRDGQPVAGGTVRIPIRFVLPLLPPEDPPLAPRSDRALELARQLIVQTDAFAVARAEFENEVRELELIPRPDLDDEVRAAVAKAMRDAYAPRMAQAAEAAARVYAHEFTAEQLQQVLAFARTRSGQVMMSRDDEARAMDTMIGREERRVASEAARRAFCATRNCSGEPDVLGLARDASQAHPKVMIASPDWAQQPSAEQIELVRPDLAVELSLGGAVRLTCKVAELGALTGCAVVSETPAGLGFGPAALSLAGFFRVSPALVAKGAAGETVAAFVTFPQPDEVASEPFSGVASRSPDALAIARQLSQPADLADYSAAWRRQLAEHPSEIPQGVTVAQVQAVGQALTAGAAVAAPKVGELRAAYLTQRLNDADLRVAAAFVNSPLGAIWKAKAGDVAVAEARVGGVYSHLVAKDAGRLFCEARGCQEYVAPPQPSAASAASSTPKP